MIRGDVTYWSLQETAQQSLKQSNNCDVSTFCIEWMDHWAEKDSVTAIPDLPDYLENFPEDEEIVVVACIKHKPICAIVQNQTPNLSFRMIHAHAKNNVTYIDDTKCLKETLDHFEEFARNINEPLLEMHVPSMQSKNRCLIAPAQSAGIGTAQRPRGVVHDTFRESGYGYSADRNQDQSVYIKKLGSKIMPTL